MATEDILLRWQRILTQVKNKNTGKSDVFAQSLGISKVTLYKDIRLINFMIEEEMLYLLDQPIKYNHRQKSYVFDDDHQKKI